jgi:hypothetical protein
MNIQRPACVLVHFTLLATLIVLGAATGESRAQSASQVRQAFADIRTDKKEFNCALATEWLFKNREPLRDQLIAELYRTDRQGRDAILFILFNTKSFTPDERFLRLVIARLIEQDSVVPNRSVGQRIEVSRGTGAHWDAWYFIDRHFDAFDALLTQQLKQTENVFFMWGLASLYQKRGLLAGRAAQFTNLVLGRATTSMRNDMVDSNASHAARLFLMLGERSLPTLNVVAAKSDDAQERNLAKALIDAITTRSVRGYGFMVAVIDIGRSVFEGGEIGTPEGAGEWEDKYVERINEGNFTYP